MRRKRGKSRPRGPTGGREGKTTEQKREDSGIDKDPLFPKDFGWPVTGARKRLREGRGKKKRKGGDERMNLSTGA